jgi:8-amino-7-oxononanoate synthase
MPSRIPDRLMHELTSRDQEGTRRTIVPFSCGVDLSSNDYLGMARRLADPEVLRSLVHELQVDNLGATGSRLVTGTTAQHVELERMLATFHRADAGLLFGSGYEANLGVMASVASRVDTFIYDEAIHASMRDGIRLSHARSFSFRHNDIDDLRSKLLSARGERFIAVESLYSMDGDIAPLSDLCAVAQECGAYLIVDEAHATGVYGSRGEGLVVERGLEDLVFARIHTFGKAIGYRGACVVGPTVLREYLINAARTFIYSTAADALSLRIIEESYRLLESLVDARAQLSSLIEGFLRLRVSYPHLEFLPSTSPIQGILCPGNDQVMRVESALHEAGVFARGIRSPTVPKGRERIRLCLHAFNSLEQLERALEAISRAMQTKEAA